MSVLTKGPQIIFMWIGSVYLMNISSMLSSDPRKALPFELVLDVY